MEIQYLEMLGRAMIILGVTMIVGDAFGIFLSKNTGEKDGM